MSNTSKKMKMEEIPFKCKVNHALKNIVNFGNAEFAMSGELGDAPLLSIVIKNKELRFPLREDELFPSPSDAINDSNSWFLKPSYFQISNPRWNSFIEELLVRIEEEMGIESKLNASLKHLLVRKTGNVDEIESETFATLVIQLPSKYSDGQSLIKHGEKSKMIEFNNEFSTFFSVFYNDCARETRPITKGVCVSLEYDLTTEDVLIPHFLSAEEIKLVNLLNSWKYSEPAKLVYVFKHEYTQKKLSIKNLKMRDKAVANFFKNFSKEYPFTVHLCYLKMKAYSNSIVYDEDDENRNFQNAKCYWLTNLVPINNSLEYENNITVNFEDQIIPVTCLNRANKYKSRTWCASYEDNGEVEIVYVKVAALVIWPDMNLIPVLRDGGADSDTITNIFLEGKRDYRTAKTVASMPPHVRTNKYEDNYLTYYGDTDDNLIVPLLNAVIEFNDVSLLRIFLTHNKTLTDEIIPLLRGQCEKFGWLSFLTELENMFKLHNVSCVIRFLEMLVGNEEIIDEEKEILWRSLAEILLEKFLESKTKYSSYCTREMRYVEVESDDQFKEEKEIIYYMLILSQKLDRASSVMEFVKDKPLTILMPILFKLASETLMGDFIELGKYCYKMLKRFIAYDELVYSWRYKYRSNCECNDCTGLKSFTESNLRSHTINFELDRQLHIKEMLKKKPTPYREICYTRILDDCLVIEKKFRSKMSLLEVLRLETQLADPLSELKAICRVSQDL